MADLEVKGKVLLTLGLDESLPKGKAEHGVEDAVHHLALKVWFEGLFGLLQVCAVLASALPARK